MAKCGKKPLPTQLKIVKGTAQSCRINAKEPKPASDQIKMPVGLSTEAKKHWKQVVKQLNEARIITNLDSVALGMYCEEYATWSTAHAAIAKHGSVIKGKGGFPVQSPYMNIANKAFEHMRGMLIEFGMTPSSRTRISTVDDGKEDDDPWSKL